MERPGIVASARAADRLSAEMNAWSDTSGATCAAWLATICELAADCPTAKSCRTALLAAAVWLT